MDQILYNRAAELLQQAEYRPSELARILGMTEANLFQEVWKGNLVASRIGKDVVRFSRADVLRWLDRRNKAHHQQTVDSGVKIGAS